MKKFEWQTAIKYGWETTKSNLVFLALITAIIFIITEGVPAYLRDVYEAQPKLLIVIYIVFFIIQQIFYMGMINITIKVTRNEKPNFSDLFNSFPYLYKYVTASFLYFCMVSIGLLLLIVPGIIWGIKYGFFGYFIVDKDAGILDSLKMSANITFGVKMELFYLSIALIGIIILGMLLFGVGVLVAYPVCMLSIAYVFRRLTAQRSRRAP